MFDWFLGGQSQKGAIDVIAIKNADGSYSCSPFHIKLQPRSSSAHSKQKIIRVKVNGQDVNLSMKMGSAGEAFFVERTRQHEFVDRRFRSSPPSSPTASSKKQLESEQPLENARLRSYSINDITAMSSVCSPSHEENTNIATIATSRSDETTTSPAPSSARKRSMTSADVFLSSSAPIPITPSTNADNLNVDCLPIQASSLPSPSAASAPPAVETQPNTASWTWTWGDLPVKTTVESLLDLHSQSQQPSSPTRRGWRQESLISDISERSEEHVGINYSTSEEQHIYRTMSLCAHILSGAPHAPLPVPTTVEELRKVLSAYAVSSEQYTHDPQAVLSHPDLVVVVNDILIPWRSAHIYLTILAQQLTHSPRMQDDVPSLMHSAEGADAWWAGKRVSSWDVQNNAAGSVVEQRTKHALQLLDSETHDIVGGVGLEGDCLHHNRRRVSGSSTQSDARQDSFGISLVDDDVGEGEDTDEEKRRESLHSNSAGDPPAALHSWVQTGAVNWSSVEDFSRLIASCTGGDSLNDILQTYIPPAEPLENILEEVWEEDADDTAANILEDMTDTAPDSTKHTLSNDVQKDMKITKVSAESSSSVSNDNIVSLADISPDDISPGPPRGDMYEDASETESMYSLSLDDGDPGEKRKIPRKYLYRKSLVPTQEQLLQMNLQEGRNEICFEGGDSVMAQLYVWPPDARIVVADVEGGVIARKAGGFSFLDLWGTSKSNVHQGVIQLFNNIVANGYRMVYITSKPITHSSTTRDDLLKATSEDASKRLPHGPVFLPPEALIRAFGPERTELFKGAVMRGVKSLFSNGHNPFHAAFGGDKKDLTAYSRAGFPPGRTYLVNEKGEVQTAHITYKKSFGELNELLNEVFPPYDDSFRQKHKPVTSPKSVPAEDSFGDFNFWRIPIRPL